MTTLQRLDGIAYWVIQDSTEIHELINTQIRKEWAQDAKDEGRDPRDDAWLRSLQGRKWQLEILKPGDIKPDPYEFIPRAGYNFERRLGKRSQQLRKAVETHGSVIWPRGSKGRRHAARRRVLSIYNTEGNERSKDLRLRRKPLAGDLRAN